MEKEIVIKWDITQLEIEAKAREHAADKFVPRARSIAEQAFIDGARWAFNLANKEVKQ